MPNSNSELTQPQNIIQNRIKYLSATLIISSAFIVLWGIFARLSVNSKAAGFILPAFSVRTIMSTSQGTVKSLTKAQSVELVRVLRTVDTQSIKNSVTKYTNLNQRKGVDSLIGSGTYTYPIASAIPRLNEYLNNINSILEVTAKIEDSSANLQTTLRANQQLTNNRANRLTSLENLQISSIGEICYEKGDPLYIQEDQQRETKLRQAASNALVKLSIFRSTYQPLQYIHTNEIKQNAFLAQLTNEANKLTKSKVITKNKYIDVQSRLLSSNSAILSSLKEKQALQVQIIEAFYALATAYVQYVENAYVRAESDMCIFERIIPDKAIVDKSELLALAIPSNSRSIRQNETGNVATASKQSRDQSRVLDIPFFYLANSDKGIKVKDLALVYPSNVPRNTFGGIKGKVVDSGRVLANKSSIRWITGLSDITPFSEKNNKDQTMYFGVIRLTQDNTFTGYKWTSGNGPSYPILLGTAADIIIQVSTQSPISNILPAVRAIAGIQE